MKSRSIITLGLLAAAAGCDIFDNALSVQSPTNIPAGAYAVMGGLIGDELIDATQTADRFPYERRRMLSSDRRYAVNTCIGLGVYTHLQTARFSALNVRSLLEGWTDAQVPGR